MQNYRPVGQRWSVTFNIDLGNNPAANLSSGLILQLAVNALKANASDQFRAVPVKETIIFYELQKDKDGELCLVVHGDFEVLSGTSSLQFATQALATVFGQEAVDLEAYDTAEHAVIKPYRALVGPQALKWGDWDDSKFLRVNQDTAIARKF